MKLMRMLCGGLLACTALFALSGCNSGSSEAKDTGNTPKETTGSTSTDKKLKIGISVPAADHGWTAGVKWWSDETMKKYPNVEFNLVTADTPEKQVKDLETMMTAGMDGVVVLATESAPLTPIAKTMRDRGILVVNVDRGFLEPHAHVFIAGDNKKFGTVAGEYMAEKMGGKGNLVILEGIPCTVNTDRLNGFKEVMAKFPDIKILDSQSGSWNREKSYKVMQTLLVKHPQIDAVWASDDDMAVGAEKAIREAGREGQMWMLGGGGMKEVVKYIMDGNPMYPATVIYSPKMIVNGIERCVEILSGPDKDAIMKGEQKSEVLDVPLVTKDNAKDFYFPDSIY